MGPVLNLLIFAEWISEKYYIYCFYGMFLSDNLSDKLSDKLSDEWLVFYPIQERKLVPN